MVVYLPGQSEQQEFIKGSIRAALEKKVREII